MATLIESHIRDDEERSWGRGVSVPSPQGFNLLVLLQLADALQRSPLQGCSQHRPFPSASHDTCVTVKSPVILLASSLPASATLLFVLPDA